MQLAHQWDRVREEQPDLFVRRRLYRDAVASWRHRSSEQGGTVPDRDDLEEPWDDEEVERRREVLRALDDLTPRQRAVVVLRWFEERSEGDAAQVLGCSVDTVRTEGVEALGRLRAALPRADLGAGGGR